MRRPQPLAVAAKTAGLLRLLFKQRAAPRICHTAMASAISALTFFVRDLCTKSIAVRRPLAAQRAVKIVIQKVAEQRLTSVQERVAGPRRPNTSLAKRADRPLQAVRNIEMGLTE